MFSKTSIASAALMATAAVAESIGSARVVNMCSYPVYLCNTPAADGGYEQIDKTLNATGGLYEQQFTALSNGDGWSLKLSKSSSDMSNIMQYEYTYHSDDEDIIWYDLSDVNGNPWDSNWEITATSDSGECNPKQQAYRYATDDAYGMQACPQDSVITVTLCSGDEANDAGAASASSTAAEQTSAAATQSSTFTTPTQSAPSQYTIPHHHTWVAAVRSSSAPSSAETTSTEASSAVATSVQPTTFATSTTAIITEGAGITVTEVQTAVVTDVVTATYWRQPAKRHEHHHRRHGADVA